MQIIILATDNQYLAKKRYLNILIQSTDEQKHSAPYTFAIVGNPFEFDGRWDERDINEQAVGVTRQYVPLTDNFENRSNQIGWKLCLNTHFKLVIEDGTRCPWEWTLAIFIYLCCLSHLWLLLILSMSWSCMLVAIKLTYNEGALVYFFSCGLFLIWCNSNGFWNTSFLSMITTLLWLDLWYDDLFSR